MLSDLTLLSGNDIPFIPAEIVIHQPRLKEIGLIGEEEYFTGCEMLNFSKDMLSEEDRSRLEDKSNFNILIAILKERNAVMQKNRNCIEMVLTLLFPNYIVTIEDRGIVLKKEDEKEEHIINESNFNEFQEIVKEIFAYNKKENEKEKFNPAGELSKKIANKLRKRHQKIAELKNEQNKKIDIISRYVSILAVGQSKDINTLLNYTLYQLFDEFKRYELKVQYDTYLKAKLAGATDLKDVDDWMKDIHSDQ